MKDIIIIGTGKAAFLHSYSYNKFKNVGEIYYVAFDGKIKDKNLKIDKTYLTINEVIENNKLETNNVIVDICTPKSVFIDIIEECKKLNITNIIVEKPFIIDEEFFINNEKLNIIMMQNYLYSKITRKVKEIIEKKHLKVNTIYTNFSKNRIEESFNGRGMYLKTTRNIEHDIPHQVYIANYILDNKYKETKELFQEEKSITKNEITLDRHAYSKIICKKGDVLVIHESDFTTETTIREVIVVCEDNIIVKGEYLIYDAELNKIRDGKINIYINGQPIYEENIDFDDNMYECLLEYYSYFNNEKESSYYKNKLLDFSKEMKIYLEK